MGFYGNLWIERGFASLRDQRLPWSSKHQKRGSTSLTLGLGQETIHPTSQPFSWVKLDQFSSEKWVEFSSEKWV